MTRNKTARIQWLFFISGILIFSTASARIQTEDLPQDPFERGKVLFSQFQYAQAIMSFDQAVRADPKNKMAYYYRGRCLVELGYPDKALAVYNHTLLLDSNFSLGYTGKAQVWILKKDFEQAASLLEKALELNPNNPEAHYQKGLMFGYLKQYQNSIDSFNRCLEIHPDHAYAHYQIGLAYNEIKRKDMAVVHLEKFLKLAPEAPEAEQVRNLLRFLK